MHIAWFLEHSTLFGCIEVFIFSVHCFVGTGFELIFMYFPPNVFSLLLPLNLENYLLLLLAKFICCSFLLVGVCVGEESSSGTVQQWLLWLFTAASW